MNNYKILITGASSKTAEALVRFFRNMNNYELVLLSTNADKFPEQPNVKNYASSILDYKNVKKIAYDEKPDIIIHTAALTNVDLCEIDKKLAWEMNVTSVENILSISRVLDSHLIYFSTDYIFDGLRGPYTEEDRPNPISYYGKSKHASENACRAGNPKTTVLRTNVVYGISSYGKNDFINWLLTKMEMGEELNVVKGQYCNPTFTDDIARSVHKIIEKNRYGVYNIGGADWLNRYDIALKVAKVFNYDMDKINPIPSSKLIQSAKRPEKGGLVTLKAETDLGIKFSTLEDGLMALRRQINEKVRSTILR